jgi:hypothetical protein
MNKTVIVGLNLSFFFFFFPFSFIYSNLGGLDRIELWREERVAATKVPLHSFICCLTTFNFLPLNSG